MNTNLLNVVKQLIADNGETILIDARRMNAFFGDLAKDEPKPGKRAFLAGIEAGAYNAFKTAPDAAERASRKATLAERLHTTEGFDLALCNDALDLFTAALFAEQPETPRCPSCGKDVDTAWKACPFCGTEISATPQAAPEPQQVPAAQPEAAAPEQPTQSAPLEQSAPQPAATAPAKQAGALEGDLRRELLGRWNWKTITVIVTCAVLIYLNGKFQFTRIGIGGGLTLAALITVALYFAFPIVLCGLCGALPAGIAAIACPLTVLIALNAPFSFYFPFLLTSTIRYSIFAASVCSAPFLGLRPARGVMPGANLAIYAAILFAGDISSFYAYRVLYQWYNPSATVGGGYVTPYRAVVFVGIAVALVVLWCIAARYRKQCGADGTRQQA